MCGAEKLGSTGYIHCRRIIGTLPLFKRISEMACLFISRKTLIYLQYIFSIRRLNTICVSIPS